MNCSNEDIVKLLVESEALSEGEVVAYDLPLKQIGVQSLDKFNVFLLIEEEFGVVVPDEEFANLDTIADIAKYVDAKSE